MSWVRRMCGYGGYAYPRLFGVGGSTVPPTFQTRNSIIFFKFSVQNGAFSAISNDFRFRIWLKMHHSAHEISKIFSDLRRAAGTIFCTPTFQMKVTPLSGEVMSRLKRELTVKQCIKQRK